MGLGKILTLFVIIGSVMAFLDKKLKKKIIILFSLLAFVFFFYVYYIAGGIYTRNFTSFIPVLIIFGAYGITKSVNIVYKNTNRWYVITLLITTIVTAYPSLWYSPLLSYSFSKETNNTCIQQWLNESLPKNVKVAIVPPILPSDAFRLKNAQTTDISIRSDYTLSELQEKKFDYLAMNITTYLSHSILWTYQGTNFWNMPITLLDNTLVGLNIQNLSPYAVKWCTKPWPTFDDNYVVFKIPAKPVVINEKLQKEFATFKNAWHIFPKDSTIRKIEETNEFIPVSFSKLAPQFPSYQPSTAWLFYPPRFQSEGIQIIPNKTYKAVFMVTPTKKIDEQERDGFVRLDFYEKKEDIAQGRSKATYISPRLFGDSESKQLVVVGKSYGARFATISFQADNLTHTFILSKAALYEVTTQSDIKNPIKVDETLFYAWYIL